MSGEAHRPRLRASKELVARVTNGSGTMRERTRQQRADVAELRRRRDQMAPDGRRVERLWPSFVRPENVPAPVPARDPGPLVLLCGVCDAVLVADATPAVSAVLQCSCCLAYNVRKPDDLLSSPSRLDRDPPGISDG